MKGLEQFRETPVDEEVAREQGQKWEDQICEFILAPITPPSS